MRGIEDYNFPAFCQAEANLRSNGFEVLNPAQHDIDAGFDTSTPPEELTKQQMEEYMKRDMEMIMDSNGVCVLPGFEKSKGALAEIAVARFLGKPVYHYPNMELLKPEKNVSAPAGDVLIEALELTTGDRQNQYGSADQDFARTATMWSALKGVEFTTEDVASFLICVKLSRNTHQAKRDNYVDIAGYARCGDLCRQEKEQRNGVQNASNAKSK